MTSLKEVMKSIRNSRGLTAIGMSMTLGITPSYLSRIENKGCIPIWFVDRVSSLFSLDHNEIHALNKALNDIYYNSNDKIAMKTKVMRLKQDCIARIYALVGSILSGTVEVSKQIHLEIVSILNEMRKFYDTNQTLI